MTLSHLLVETFDTEFVNPVIWVSKSARIVKGIFLNEVLEPPKPVVASRSSVACRKNHPPPTGNGRVDTIVCHTSIF